MTINWDVFYIFTIVSVILWIISAVTSAAKDGISKTAVAASLSGSVDLFAKASAQNNGRNTIMVFTIHGNIRTYHLLEMEIQMDTILLYSGICSVLHHQHTQAGDTRPIFDACPAKRMVHPSCDCIYVFILSTWMRIHYRMYRNEKA